MLFNVELTLHSALLPYEHTFEGVLYFSYFCMYFKKKMIFGFRMFSCINHISWCYFFLICY